MSMHLLQSLRRMRGTYHRTRPWLTWFLFSLLLFLSLLVDVTFKGPYNNLTFTFSCAPAINYLQNFRQMRVQDLAVLPAAVPVPPGGRHLSGPYNNLTFTLTCAPTSIWSQTSDFWRFGDSRGPQQPYLHLILCISLDIAAAVSTPQSGQSHNANSFFWLMYSLLPSVSATRNHTTALQDI